jgi:hypothetical protein
MLAIPTEAVAGFPRALFSNAPDSVVVIDVFAVDDGGDVEDGIRLALWNTAVSDYEPGTPAVPRGEGKV